jgi:undecaprenyl-diphosphatase
MFLDSTMTLLPSFLLVVDESQPLSFMQAIVIGIVQGLTEFLPISSTAHIKMVPVVFGWGDPGVTFTAVVQLGSIVAIVGYFWGDIWQLLTGVKAAIAEKNWQAPDFRVAVGIVIGTIPIVVLGLLVKFGLRDVYETFARSSLVIAITSIGLAIFLGWAEVVGSRQRGYDKVSQRDGIGHGLGPGARPHSRCLPLGFHHDGRVIYGAKSRNRRSLFAANGHSGDFALWISRAERIV